MEYKSKFKAAEIDAQLEKIAELSANSISITSSKDELGKLDVPLGSIGSIVSEEHTFEAKPSQVEKGTIIKGIKFNSTPPNYFDYASEHHIGFTFGFSLEGVPYLIVNTYYEGMYYWEYVTDGLNPTLLTSTTQGAQTDFNYDAISSLNEMLSGPSHRFFGLDIYIIEGFDNEYTYEVINNFIDSCITFVCYKPTEVSGPYVKTSKGIDEPTPRKFSDFGDRPELFPKEERVVKNFEFLFSVSDCGLIGFETIGGSVIKLLLPGWKEEWFISYDDDEKPLTEEELQNFKELVNSTTVYYTLLQGTSSFMTSVDTLVSADFPLPPLKELKTWTPIAAPIPSDDIDSLLAEVFGGGYYYSDDGIGSWDDYAYEADGIGEFEETNVEELNTENNETGS